MMELVSSKNINVHESLAILEKRQKDGELSYEQQNTLTHLQAVAKMSVKEANDLEKALNDLKFLKENQVVMIVNTLPKNVDEVKFILSQEKNAFTLDQMKEVLKVVKDNKP